ncbi:hypothetical protein AB0K09_00610 [Streptomyces sp. NPDC049577]|uniref:hypothetical protein n=1 Tax=Streptomyces sp. NPDC049577 TaxID=3155153 RepID=UPI003444CBED
MTEIAPYAGALLSIGAIAVTWAVRLGPKRASAPAWMATTTVFVHCTREGGMRPHIRHTDGSLLCWDCIASGGPR